MFNRILCAGFFATVYLSGCATAPANARPVLSILSPVDGARVSVSETVNVLVAAASSNKISAVEIRADGAILGTLPNDPPSTTFSGRVVFRPQKPGIAQLNAVAFDALGGASEIARLQLIVEPAPLVAAPGVQVTRSSPAAVERGVPPGCALNAIFVTDVSFPDKTVIHGGDGFIKTWRLRNASGCDWNDGFEIYFVSGDKMSALASGPVLPARKGETVDVSMGFRAPKSNGEYTSIWQLRAPGGQPFGTKFYVLIKVIDQ